MSRRTFMLGSASVAAMIKTPCAKILVPLEEAPVLPTVRSKVFANALRFWPRWAADLDPNQDYFPPAYRLDIHQDPNFLKLSREERFSKVETNLLNREQSIEQGLTALPEKIAARTGLPIEKVRNLTRLFLDDSMISNSSVYRWMRHHRGFYLAAVEELMNVDPNFGVIYRLAIDRFFSNLDDTTLDRKKLRFNLEDGHDELLRIEAQVMELSGDWKTVMDAAHAIYRHWWFDIFPGYNRLPALSDMRKSRAGLESLNRFLANDLPKLDLAQIKEPAKFVPDPDNPGWGKVPALDDFPVRSSIAKIKAEANSDIQRLRLTLQQIAQDVLSEELKRALLSPIQAELDNLKELIEAPVRVTSADDNPGSDPTPSLR